MRTIKSKQDFERVFHQGRSYRHPLMRMIACNTLDEGDPGRVAFVAAKRLGNAVFRNRCKRVLREAARRASLPADGYDVILFSTPQTHGSTPEQVARALEKLLTRAGV